MYNLFLYLLYSTVFNFQLLLTLYSHNELLVTSLFFSQLLGGTQFNVTQTLLEHLQPGHAIIHTVIINRNSKKGI